jgi:hypothetical protein
MPPVSGWINWSREIWNCVVKNMSFVQNRVFDQSVVQKTERGEKIVLSQWELRFPKFTSFWTSPVEYAEIILRVPVVRNLLNVKLHCAETRPQPLLTLFTYISLLKQVKWVYSWKSYLPLSPNKPITSPLVQYPWRAESFKPSAITNTLLALYHFNINLKQYSYPEDDGSAFLQSIRNPKEKHCLGVCVFAEILSMRFLYRVKLLVLLRNVNLFYLQI